MIRCVYSPDRSVVRLVVMQHVPVGVQQPVRLQQLPHRQHTAYDLPQPFTVVARLAELCDVFAGGFDRRPEQFLFIPHLCRERGEIRRYGLRFHSAHHGGDKVEQLVHRERLVDAGRESGGGKSLPFLVTPCGHGDDRNRARIANIGIAQQFQQVKTVRSGHLYIRQEQVVVRFAYLPDSARVFSQVVQETPLRSSISLTILSCNGSSSMAMTRCGRYEEVFVFVPLFPPLRSSAAGEATRGTCCLYRLRWPL